MDNYSTRHRGVLLQYAVKNKQAMMMKRSKTTTQSVTKASSSTPKELPAKANASRKPRRLSSFAIWRAKLKDDKNGAPEKLGSTDAADTKTPSKKPTKIKIRLPSAKKASSSTS